MLSSLILKLNSVKKLKRPVITLQHGMADCGYVCVAAILTIWRVRATVEQIKQVTGETSRGLTIRQLRDCLRQCGVKANALIFDNQRVEAYPVPGIVLLKEGHFIFLDSREGNTFESFYPDKGWTKLSLRRLTATTNGLGISVESVDTQVFPALRKQFQPRHSIFTDPFNVSAIHELFTKLGGKLLTLILVAQLATLSLPLLSQKSVDAVSKDLTVSLGATIGIAFLAITLISNLTTIFSAVVDGKVQHRIGIRVSSMLFDRLAGKSSSWFDQRPSGHAYNQVLIAVDQAHFIAGLVTNGISLLLTLAVGVVALFFISPWLVIPGLISMTASVLIDWKFSAALTATSGRMMSAHQKQRAFMNEVIAQLPMLGRFGSLWSVRTQFRKVARQTADATQNNTAINGSRDAIASTVKGVEQVAFICAATYFMRTEDFSLGVFVAVGVYKDHLANSIKSIFQLYQRYRILEPHRAELSELTSSAPHIYTKSEKLSTGQVEVKNVSFRYGRLETEILRDVNMTISPGESIILVGESGAGKTTLARLLSGLLLPTTGEILIDGEPATRSADSIGVVMQADRLITGSIRNNVTIYRREIAESDIWHALELADLKNFVMSLPMKLETYVGEGLSGLSGGQRQRLLLSRALLSKPKMLVLDEATSSLDIHGEARILNNLKAMGVTTVMCAHRPEVRQYASRVYSVEDLAVSLISQDQSKTIECTGAKESKCIY